MIADFACPRCGTIERSGKISCCGRGGSWFKNCGVAGNRKLHHTWYEGIQVCKARSQPKTVIDQQLNGAQQIYLSSSQGTEITNYKAAIAASKTFTFTLVNTSTPLLDTTSIVTSTYTSSTRTSLSTSIIAKGFVNLLRIIIHVNLLFIFVL